QLLNAITSILQDAALTSSGATQAAAVIGGATAPLRCKRSLATASRSPPPVHDTAVPAALKPVALPTLLSSGTSGSGVLLGHSCRRALDARFLPASDLPAGQGPEQQLGLLQHPFTAQQLRHRQQKRRRRAEEQQQQQQHTQQAAPGPDPEKGVPHARTGQGQQQQGQQLEPHAGKMLHAGDGAGGLSARAGLEAQWMQQEQADADWVRERIRQRQSTTHRQMKDLKKAYSLDELREWLRNGVSSGSSSGGGGSSSSSGGGGSG
ncbi:hypothetical protein Agub_g14391, partial [Astrephomene gubernaculifera]